MTLEANGLSKVISTIILLAVLSAPIDALVSHVPSSENAQVSGMRFVSRLEQADEPGLLSGGTKR